jgi:putative tricarboxylic transport membrane protein
MTIESERDATLSRPPWWQALTHKDVLAGLLFMAIAILGLWLSRDYPIGTALRMNTGYVPRLLCWILLALGGCLLVQGLRTAANETAPDAAASFAWRPLLFVTGSLVLFGLTIERLGLVIAILLLIGVGAFALRGRRVHETIAAAVVLIALSWGIFIFALQLTIRVWPEW